VSGDRDPAAAVPERARFVATDHRAEGLIAALRDAGVAGARVLLPRAAGAREILPRELERLGATVEEVVTYRSGRPSTSVAILRAALDAGPLDAVAFTSSSTVRGFLALLGEAGIDREGRARALAGTRIACIGPITAATAREEGLAVDVVPDSYTVPALAEAIIAELGGGEGRAAPAFPRVGASKEVDG
jgi:uroporphyrinogen III methyltransferase/synthase